MVEVNNFEEIVDYSLAFIKDDYTELWVIVNKIHDENPELSFNELIQATTLVLIELIEKHEIMLFDELSMKPKDLSKEEILEIVDNHLNSLNKIPNIGDGIWFTI